MSTRLSRLLLIVAATSVALNIFLLVTRGRSKSRPRPAADHRMSSGAPKADCCRGLAQCQRQRYISALQALRGTATKPQTTQPPARPSPASQPAPRTGIGPKEQQAALCEVATEGLRKAWTASGEALTKNLRKSLADDADQERGMEREVKRFGDALDLTPADRDRLETHYRPLRKKRIAQALAGLEKDPPDWRAAHSAAQSLWQDQDRLTKELFGSDAVKKLRRAELKPRTTVLALIAAQAGLDWNQSITW